MQSIQLPTGVQPNWSGLKLASKLRPIDAIFNLSLFVKRITLLSLLLFPNRVLALDLVEAEL